MRRRKKKQHKEAIVFQNRIYSHGTATNEIKLKYFLVEKQNREQRKHISNSIFRKNIQLSIKKTNKQYSYRNC